MTYLSLMANWLNAQSFNWQWAKNATGPDNFISDIAHDKNGNVYGVGVFIDDFIDLEDTTLINENINGSAIFIVKYSPTGIMLWVNSIQSHATILTRPHITIDRNGYCYVAGNFKDGSILFNSDTIVSTSNNINGDFYVAKYDSFGNLLSAKNEASASCTGLITDSSGFLYVTGSLYQTSTPFGQYILTNNSAYLPFITKYDLLGNVVWAKSANSLQPVTAISSCIAVDKENNVYIAGQISLDTTIATLSFDTVSISLSQGREEDKDMFIVKYSSLGEVIWVNNAPACCQELLATMTIDSTGALYIAGFFTNNIIFETDTLTGTNQIYESFFVAKFNTQGNFQWAREGGGSLGGVGVKNVWATSIASNSKGDVYVVGGFNSEELIFGGDTLYPPSFFKNPGFVLTLDSYGNELCIATLGSDGNDYIVKVDDFDNAYIAGRFDLNPLIIGNFALPLTGTVNAFLAKFTCDFATSIEQDQIQSSTLQLYPNPFTTQATIKYTLPNNSINASLIIYDILGRERSSYKLNITEGEININASTLSSGVYFYSLVVDGRMLATNKMVVQQ